ncbi:MAG TPA: hypothetical protein VF331_11625 [Polyangiales bacterium]
MKPLHELGVPIDLRGVQAGMLLIPVVMVAGALIHAWLKKRRQMKDAGM